MAHVVLGIAGSPRRNGNTETLLDWALGAAEEGGAETIKFRVGDMSFGGCTACESCFETGSCVLDDDLDALYPYLRQADGILLAGPIFSMGLAAQTKALIDRCQPFWAIKYIQKARVSTFGRSRYGGFLSCAGSNLEHVFDGALQVVRYFWNVLDVTPVGQLLARGVDAKGEVANYPSARERAEAIGQAVGAPQPAGSGAQSGTTQLGEEEW